MKITIDIDTTPDEARKFFGLPDVAPMQEALMADMTERMRAALAGMDQETLWRQWMPTDGGAGQGLDAMRQFWEQAMGAGFGAGKPKSD